MNHDSSSRHDCPEIKSEDLHHDRGFAGSLVTQCAWSLKFLNTTLEVRAGVELVDVYVVRVPTQAAHSFLNLLRSKLPHHDGLDLQHLRRFAKAEGLPHHIRSKFSNFLANNESFGDVTESNSLYLLAGVTNSLLASVLRDCVSTIMPDLMIEDATIYKVPVPRLAPTSQEQAIRWTTSHWPTVYKKHNRFGPHPAIISRAESEILGDLQVWMEVAERVAVSSKSDGIGEAIGAVIVERIDGRARAVALAGDARWKCPPKIGNGNVMAHAALRAIGMVAQKLTATNQANSGIGRISMHQHNQGIFMDHPLQREEAVVFGDERLIPNGYLCHNLEMYITHEPCVMCSMALLHSRFGRVVFQRRMPKTGGLCSKLNLVESSSACQNLGYGLFWRRELNWALLAWEASPKFAASTDCELSVQA